MKDSLLTLNESEVDFFFLFQSCELFRDFPGCGNIVTFAQFVFIALEGFIFETNFGRKKPAIPLRYPALLSNKQLQAKIL